MANYIRTTFLVQPSPGDIAVLFRNKQGQVNFEVFVRSIVAIWQDGNTVKIKTDSSDKSIVLDFSTPQEALVALQYANKAIDEIRASLAPPTPSGGPQFFEFHQISATTSWFVTHTMNARPNVTITDDSATPYEIEGLVRYLDNSHIMILFNQPVSGWVFLS